jgi:hypothetical protein
VWVPVEARERLTEGKAAPEHRPEGTRDSGAMPIIKKNVSQNCGSLASKYLMESVYVPGDRVMMMASSRPKVID